LQVEPYLQRSCAQHPGSFIFGHIWGRRALLVWYLLVAVVCRLLRTSACIAVNYLPAAYSFLLIFVGLVDIGVVWCWWFWSFLLQLIWFVINLLSIIWAEAVEDRKLVFDRQLQGIQAMRRGRRTLHHRHRRSQTS
jgi:hypothetical protein